MLVRRIAIWDPAETRHTDINNCWFIIITLITTNAKSVKMHCKSHRVPLKPHNMYLYVWINFYLRVLKLKLNMLKKSVIKSSLQTFVCVVSVVLNHSYFNVKGGNLSHSNLSRRKTLIFPNFILNFNWIFIIFCFVKWTTQLIKFNLTSKTFFGQRNVLHKLGVTFQKFQSD